MRTTDSVHERVRARDRAQRLINQLTVAAALGGVAALGVFGAVDAMTVPGSSSGTAGSGATQSSSGTSTGSTSTSTSTSGDASSLQPSSSSVSSSSSAPIVVSGGSH